MQRIYERVITFVLAMLQRGRKDCREYELMTFFAIATLYRYRKEIVLSPVAGEKAEEFAERNKDIVRRVADEALSLYDYILTPEQKGRAIRVYLAPSLSVRSTPVAVRESPLK